MDEKKNGAWLTENMGESVCVCVEGWGGGFGGNRRGQNEMDRVRIVYSVT